MNTYLSCFLNRISQRVSYSSRLRNRHRFRKYLVESLEPRNLLATLTSTSLTDNATPAESTAVFKAREASLAANASLGVDDTIQFALVVTANGPSTITLPDGELKSVAMAGDTSIIDLSNLHSAGTTINGQAAGDRSGRSVSSAGDVNGDGFDDLIVGAYRADSPVQFGAGKSYVIFGGSSLPAKITLSNNLGTTNPGVGGFNILGQAVGDFSGGSVSSAGDVNGDGFDDLIVGAVYADPANLTSNSNAGKSYVIFGGNGFTNSILPENLGNSTSNTINGTSAANILNGADGDDTLVGSGGADVLLGGRGNDILAVSDLTFNRIVGGNGNDTLRLDGSGLSLDLRAIKDNRIRDIETIDMSGSGDNELILNAAEVLRLSTSTNELKVKYNLGDKLQIGTGWELQGPKLVNGSYVHKLSASAAKLEIENTFPFQNPVNRLDTNFSGFVSPLDALVVINALLRSAFINLPLPGVNEFYLDVSGDNVVAPLDILLVINFLNLRPAGEGEGVGELQSVANGVTTASHVDAIMTDMSWLEPTDLVNNRRRSSMRTN